MDTTPLPLPKANFNYPTSYRIGAGRIRELSAACRELEMAHPLLVTDPGVAALPWFVSIQDELRQAGIRFAVFSQIGPNPAEDDVTRGTSAYREGEHDGCVLIGGGAPMDVGKCIALLVNNPGSLFDYEDVGDNWKRASADRIPKTIAIPSTAGTGSEVGRASVILDERDHNKKIIFHPRMQPALVIADPELTIGLPKSLTAATGMDAFAHCFEAFCAPGYHPMADGISLEGMRLIKENLPKCFADGQNLTARTHMLMAAAMGATAFQKGLGLIHALSHPLGGITGMHHGLANAVFLPYVMAYNRAFIEEPMTRLARHLDLPNPGYETVLRWVLDLRESLGIPHTLADAGYGDVAFAKSVAPLALHDPSLATNPRPAGLEDLERVTINSIRGDLSS